MRRLLLCASLCLLGLAPASGCILERSCSTNYVFGVSAIVRDARSSAPISDATLVLVDGAYRETMSSFGAAGTYAGAGERAGTYTLTATANGYQPSAPRTVVVTEDAAGCHVVGQPVTIELTPL